MLIPKEKQLLSMFQYSQGDRGSLVKYLPGIVQDLGLIPGTGKEDFQALSSFLKGMEGIKRVLKIFC